MDDRAVEVLLVEYEHLKKEQSSRIRVRDNLLYASLIAAASVLAVVHGSSNDFVLLLLLPPVSLILGWTYLINDQKVSAIGDYIRARLTPNISYVIEYSDVFEWEIAHRSDPRRLSRKLMQLGVDLIAFCAVPVVALMVYASRFPEFSGLMAVAVAEGIAVLLLACQFLVYARL